MSGVIPSSGLMDALIGDPVTFLSSLRHPLTVSEPEGLVVREVMLGGGEALRSLLPVLRPVCSCFPEGLVVLSDGSVTTCSIDPFGENILGSVYQTDLLDLWSETIVPKLSGDLYRLPRCRRCIGAPGGAVSLLSAPGAYDEWSRQFEQFPKILQIEIAGDCNYACMGCAAPYIKGFRETRSELDRIFENIRSALPRVQALKLFNFGEPLLHEGFCDFLGRCREAAPHAKIILSTNGMLLDEAVSRRIVAHRPDIIIVSIHGGPGTENMLKYSHHGADYERVLSNIRTFLAIKRDTGAVGPKLSVKGILFSWNDSEEAQERFRCDMHALGLIHERGNVAGADSYFWTLDNFGFQSSNRYMAGSPEIYRLIESGEI